MEWNNKYNVFNSMKCLSHVNYWSGIKDGIIPNPLFVSLDPSGTCDIKCNFCNSQASLSKDKMDILMINKVVDVLYNWGTKAVCVGGGGEPLTNISTGYLIERLLSADIEVGMITNGTMIENHLDILSRLKWIGISVDASNREMYSLVKGTTPDKFDKVTKGISKLSEKNGCVDIEFKFLVTNKNFMQISSAAKLARSIGCDFIHVRPGGNPHTSEINSEFSFTSDQLDDIKIQMNEIVETHNSDEFRAFGITHKFNSDLSPAKTFNKCYAGYTTCFISPAGMIGLCVCRRGDKRIELCHIDDVMSFWGSKKHIDILESIDVSKCPNCTYTHINEIVENVIMEDKMSRYFI